jgi:hypothetical protein
MNKYIEVKLPPFQEMKKIIFDKDNISDVPKIAGIYFLFHKELKYVGMASNLYNRICWHKTYSTKIFSEIFYIEVPDRLERKLIERYCIETFKPVLNGNNTLISKCESWFETKQFLVCPDRNLVMSKPEAGGILKDIYIIRENGEIFSGGKW